MFLGSLHVSYPREILVQVGMEALRFVKDKKLAANATTVNGRLAKEQRLARLTDGPAAAQADEGAPRPKHTQDRQRLKVVFISKKKKATPYYSPRTVGKCPLKGIEGCTPS